MRKWEDIVKDKMEEPEGALPESVMAEFHARRERVALAPAQRRFRLAWAVIPAVAAGLAVLLLHKPAVPEEAIQVIPQPSAPVAVWTDSSSVREPEQSASLFAQTITPKEARPSPVKPQEVRKVEPVEPVKDNIPADLEEKTVEPDATQGDSSIPGTSSPFIPENTPTKPVTMKVGPAAGMIAGGGLLAAVITPFLGSGTKADPSFSDYYGDLEWNPGPIYASSNETPLGNPVHNFPLKVGLTARIPLTEKLFISTGLAYSFYQSSFVYSLSGEKKQTAHYLGIPVTLNRVLASNKLFDVYVGGGLEGDVCLGAYLAGKKVEKDGFGLSLKGVGGIQMNITERMGLYVEPELRWQVPLNTAVLETYRSEHLLMFSVTAGLRFNIGKQN